MPRFTLFWIITYTLGLLACFVNPVFGTYTYLFEYYLRPPLHWWGKGHLPDLRWNLMISVVLTTTFLLKRTSLPDIGKAPATPAKCLLALVGVMLVVQQWAVNPDLSWLAITQFLKLILFHGLVVGTIRSEQAFDGFIAMHMAGAGWWGWEAYQNPRREQGRLAAVGSGDTWSDNFAAAHLLTVIPFLFVYLFVHKDKKLKALAAIAAPFVINTFILCNSRGSTVGLLTAVGMAIIASRSGNRLRLMGVTLAGAFAFYVLADPEFIARQQTTTSYQEDGSATQRLESWRGGLRFLRDYPLGGGGDAYWELSPIYIPSVVEEMKGEKRVPHNTYVLAATDWGIQGLVLLLGYYGSVLWLARRVRKRAPEGGIWYYRAFAIEVAVVGLMVAATFSDRLYGEAPYWIGGLSVALHRLQSHKLRQESAATPEAQQPSAAAPTEPTLGDYVRARMPAPGAAR